MNRYQTIRETAAHDDFPNEGAIRRMVKEGKCPGFFQHTRFYVDVELLRQQLDQACSRERSAEA